MATLDPSPVIQKGHGKGQSPPNKGRTFPPEILTADEISQLMQTCSNRAPTGIRNRALIVIMYRGGLRLSEALALRPKDLDAKAGSVTILHGKGGKRRTAGLDPGAIAVISRWLDKRKELGLTGRAKLFCTLSGRPLHASYVRTALHRLAKKAGIEKRVHPHGLRHAHAAELTAEDVPLNIIQAQLGHTNAATTSRYLQHIAPKHVIDAMRAREWEG